MDARKSQTSLSRAGARPGLSILLLCVKSPGLYHGLWEVGFNLISAGKVLAFPLENDPQHSTERTSPVGMVREGFLKEGTSDFIQPELSLFLRVLAKASLRQRDCHEEKPEFRDLRGCRPFLLLHK